MEGLGLVESLAAASTPVQVIIGTMTVMAFGCVYVAVERTWTLGKARGQSRRLAESVGGAMAEGGAPAALEVAKKPEYKDSYLGHLLVPALTEFTSRPDKHGIEATERAIQRATLDEDPVLKKGFGILATTGATCPFVGLVGTVFGIIEAFGAMQGEGGANVMALVGPIAEALYATAIGIGVAILGVWLFNYFNHRVDQIKKDMNTSTLELLDWCEKQVLPPFENAAK
jgi:biopolymer transport protein ExbB